MANGFIRQPNQLAALQADYAALQEELTKERLRARTAESRLFTLAAQQEDDEANCPECEDLCSLRQLCDDADMDVVIAQDLYVNEFGENCNYWQRAFACKGLSAEYECVQQLVNATLHERKYQFAVAAHNLAYCEARNAPDFIECKKAELLELMEQNPDMDSRCLAQINKALACVCA